MIRAFLCALLSAIALVACNEGKSPEPAQTGPLPQPPAQSRPGLLYGYYGSMHDQVAETANHVNLQWVSPWGNLMPLDNVIARLTEARAWGIPRVVLDVPMAYEVDAEVKTRAFFASLHAAGFIDSRISALYPVDEPDLHGKSAEEVIAANAMLRRVAAEFPFIANVPLAVIYTGRMEWPGIETYDWIGFDDYDRKEGVLSNATWQDLKRRLRPEQRILLVPGAHQCDQVAPFYAKAQEDPQVLAIVAFIWFDAWDQRSPGLRSLPCRASYEDVGRRIKSN